MRECFEYFYVNFAHPLDQMPHLTKCLRGSAYLLYLLQIRVTIDQFNHEFVYYMYFTNMP